MYIRKTWDELSPPGTTWEELAYRPGIGWLTWDDLMGDNVTCTSIEIANCTHNTTYSNSSITATWLNSPLPTIGVYNKADNINELRLLNDRAVVSLDAVTKIEIRLNDSITEGLVLSSDDYPAEISWREVGIVELKLGTFDFLSRMYTAELMVFDPNHTDGLFWGFFRIRGVKEST